MIKRSKLPKGAKILRLPKRIKVTTTNGVAKIREYVILEGTQFPEFSGSLSFTKKIVALIFDDDNVSYDVVLGRSSCTDMGVTIDFGQQEVTWMGETIPFS